MLDMLKMLGKFKEMQSKVEEMQNNLVNIVAEGEAGGGMVVAKANGKKQLIWLQIEKNLLQSEDVEILQDLIVAAVNKALENAEQQAKSYLQKQAQGLLPHLSGIDLGNLMK
ncbi:MAG: YbaB/EbfC family nucleoid-associated protein [Bernardetiaceae bacterium]|nr:YbaB/EbfC family nucleoid-associated protein [Bernardetiaceae bacterium]